MLTLTESAARSLLASSAFAPSHPGLVGLTVPLPAAGTTALTAAPLLTARSAPALPTPTMVTALPGSRFPLRHGFARAYAVSGPPSPGLEAALTRMTEDLAQASPISRPPETGTASGIASGVVVSLEAGSDTEGLLGLARRWELAHLLAPVLVAAFANSPLHEGRPSGWRSHRQSRRAPRPVTTDPRADWAALVLDAPVTAPAPASGGTFAAWVGVPFREWTRTQAGPRPTVADLHRHEATVRPVISARGHLRLDLADAQPGTGWQVPAAVITALLDDPRASVQARGAVSPLRTIPDLWQRATRDALTDPVLSRAARTCFLAAYGALARWGTSRALRDAVWSYTDRYVMLSRTPADDTLDHLPR
jgi:glutamate--cysteine ligase